MSIDTEHLVKNISARFHHQANKKYLTEKYSAKLIFASQSGMWTASPELIAFLNLFDNQVVLVDHFGNPILVHAPSLRQEMTALYVSVTTDWHNEYTKLQSQ